MNVQTIDAIKEGDTLAEILASGALFPLVVTGYSMIPFLKEGRDTVYLQKTDRFYKGQIVFFRRTSNEFILHRIRKIYPDGKLLVNGDAQSWCEIIRQEQVLAEVLYISKNGRRIDPKSGLFPLLGALWYPTKPLRPLIWRCYGRIRQVFKRKQ